METMPMLGGGQRKGREMQFGDEETIVSITKSNLIRVSQSLPGSPLLPFQVSEFGTSSDEYCCSIKMWVLASFSISISMAPHCQQPYLLNH